MTKDQLLDYKNILIKTLEVFKLFCKENNLTYFACGGTAIGAVRHKGIIPWDDDIDVCMLRKDYDRFLTLKGKLVGSGYEILYHDLPNYPFPFAKFADANTSIWEFKNIPFIQGVFIDVFPLDSVTGNDAETKYFQKQYVDAYNIYLHSFVRHPFNELFRHIIHAKRSGVLTWFKDVFVNRKNKELLYKNFLKIEDQARCKEGNYLLNYYTPYMVEKEIFYRDWFVTTVEFEFEDTTIQLPNGYIEYLTQLFGDFMTPPPIDKQISNHSRYYINLNARLSVEEIESSFVH